MHRINLAFKRKLRKYGPNIRVRNWKAITTGLTMIGALRHGTESERAKKELKRFLEVTSVIHQTMNTLRTYHHNVVKVQRRIKLML